MRLTIEIAVLAILAFAGRYGVVSANPIDRHNDEPIRKTTPPMTNGAGRSFGVSEAPRCVPDADGFFGDRSANGVSLRYYYELEYDTTVLPQIGDNVLKTIQTKISQFLLPVLFQRACSDSRNRKLANTVQSTLRRRLEAVGISTLPDDVVVEGASCSYEPTGNRVSCALAFGQASIFAQEGASAEHQGDRAIEAIEIIMLEHALDSAFPGLTKVTFVNGTHVKGIDPTVFVGGPPPPAQSTTTTSGDDNGLPGFAIALITLSVLGVVAVGAFIVIRKKRQRYNERREATSRLNGALAFEELSLAGRSRDDP